MKSKKKAGLERPFTLKEFWSLINDEAVKQNVEYINELEYFDDYILNADKEIRTINFDVTSKIVYGGSEGIYATFYLSYVNGENVQFAVAKTLSKKDNDYISMHVFAANICLLAMKYIESHEDEFNWYGYNVKFIKYGKPNGGWYCPKEEQAYERAKEAKIADNDIKVFIRCNSTRKNIEYKLKS